MWQCSSQFIIRSFQVNVTLIPVVVFDHLGNKVFDHLGNKVENVSLKVQFM